MLLLSRSLLQVKFAAYRILVLIVLQVVLPCGIQLEAHFENQRKIRMNYLIGCDAARGQSVICRWQCVIQVVSTAGYGTSSSYEASPSTNARTTVVLRKLGPSLSPSPPLGGTGALSAAPSRTLGLSKIFSVKHFL